jgi:hypothetical protein
MNCSEVVTIASTRTLIAVRAAHNVCFDKTFCDDICRAGGVQEFAVSTKTFLTSGREVYFFIFVQSIISFCHILLVACYIISLSLSISVCLLSSFSLSLCFSSFSLRLYCLQKRYKNSNFVFLRVNSDKNLVIFR